ncbi:DNA mismatch repair protein Mlh1 [Nosema granulosis]|uniref:DNA mismatch repair protein Mlh1 n=1 Tax=Nosema granulosis TaxID=83296 RepID=A0A9P6H0U2_9MICR|nr:DNA mismatch repair protein Mlh1 [Nosema granulosis]
MKIQKLPDEVIKKICAGEVVTRPYNALKELLENSIDAKSTNIVVNISSNVLNITIEDNGCGIQKEDFKLLCERHCTSKLASEEGLLRISSYGFRGEALSSISQVSKITIKSKPFENELGNEGIYSNGKLVECKPISLRDGTVIVVKDIFYNNKIRELKYFKKINELNSMIDLVFFYAINNIEIRFALFVSGKEKFLTKYKAPCLCSCGKNIIHNDATFYNELLQIQSSQSPPSSHSPFHSEICMERKVEIIGNFYKINGKLSYFDSKFATIVFSRPNANFKKNISIIFVNGRLVENTSLKDTLSKIYLDILPKHRFPLIYVELRIPPGNIDVNIHPSKKEVMFNHEDIITEILGKVIEMQLKEYFVEEKENFIAQESIKRYKSPSFKQQAEDTKAYCEDTKVYCDPNTSTIYDTKATECKIRKEYCLLSLQKIRENYVEIDPEFLKNLVFVGVHDQQEFYVQHTQYLLSCDLKKFVGRAIKEFLVFNFGNFPQKSVRIPLELEVGYKEMLEEYFCIKISENEITQIPLVFGQCNGAQEDWVGFKIVGSNENEIFQSVFGSLTEIYSRNFVLNVSSFNLIKRAIKGTKETIETFKILSQLKELYNKFGR